LPGDFEEANTTLQTTMNSIDHSKRVLFVAKTSKYKNLKVVFDEVRASTSSMRKRSAQSIEPLKSEHEKLLLSRTKRSEGRFNMKLKEPLLPRSFNK